MIIDATVFEADKLTVSQLEISAATDSNSTLVVSSIVAALLEISSPAVAGAVIRGSESAYLNISSAKVPKLVLDQSGSSIFNVEVEQGSLNIRSRSNKPLVCTQVSCVDAPYLSLLSISNKGSIDISGDLFISSPSGAKTVTVVADGNASASTVVESIGRAEVTLTGAGSKVEIATGDTKVSMQHENSQQTFGFFNGVKSSLQINTLTSALALLSSLSVSGNYSTGSDILCGNKNVTWYSSLDSNLLDGDKTQMSLTLDGSKFVVATLRESKESNNVGMTSSLSLQTGTGMMSLSGNISVGANLNVSGLISAVIIAGNSGSLAISSKKMSFLSLGDHINNDFFECSNHNFLKLGKKGVDLLTLTEAGDMGFKGSLVLENLVAPNITAIEANLETIQNNMLMVRSSSNSKLQIQSGNVSFLSLVTDADVAAPTGNIAFLSSYSWGGLSFSRNNHELLLIDAGGSVKVPSAVEAVINTQEVTILAQNSAYCDVVAKASAANSVVRVMALEGDKQKSLLQLGPDGNKQGTVLTVTDETSNGRQLTIGYEGTTPFNFLKPSTMIEGKATVGQVVINDGPKQLKQSCITTESTVFGHSRRSSRNNNCFFISQVTKTFADAMLECESQNAQLVSVTNEHKNEIVKQLLIAGNVQAAGVFIGFSDVGVENGNFRWISGQASFATAQYPMGYSRLTLEENGYHGAGKRSTNTLHCVVIQGGALGSATLGKWSLSDCDATANFVCERVLF